MKRYQKILIGLVVAAMTIGAGAAWADFGSRGRGCDRGEGGYHERGFGHGRMMENLSEADQEKAKEAIETFRESNRELRQAIHQKKLAFEAEMAKSTPDAAVAAGLQKELSTLQADAAQKWLTHRIEMKKIHPDLGQGFHRKGFGGKEGRGTGDCPTGKGYRSRN